jgi:hypothetical protein
MDMSMNMLQCLACATVLIATALFVASAVRYLAARADAFAELCHPAPLEPPPRPA